MTLTNKFGIIIVSILTTIMSSKKRIEWTTEQDPIEYKIFIKIIQSIMSIIIETLIKIFIAYKFPLLFVSWVIITDPLTKKIFDFIYKRLQESFNKEPNVLQ